MIIKYDTGKKTFTEKLTDNGGKYINDTTVPKIKTVSKKEYKTLQSIVRAFWNTSLLLTIRKTCYSLYQTVQWINILVYIIREGTKLWLKYYAEFLCMFAGTFLTLPFLIILFERSPVLFFIFLLPTMILNAVALSTLYRFIDQNQQGEKITLWQSAKYCLKNVLPITLLIAYYCFFIATTILFFLGIAWAITLLLANFHIDWFRAYYYWLAILSVGTFLASLVFILTLLAQHIYYAFLLDKTNPLEEINHVLPLFRKYYIETFPLFFILIMFFIPLMFWLSISYFDVGVGILLLLVFHATFLFGYLLKKRLLLAPHLQGTRSNKIPQGWLITGLIFGTFSYGLFIVFTLSYHPMLMQFITRVQQDRVIAQELTTYTNDDYGYAINYPRSWTIYRWQPNVTTLFDNNTGTFIGGIWVDITVTYVDKTNIHSLLTTKNGATLPINKTIGLVRKLRDITVGTNKGVEYTVVKSGFPLSDYETHYLIQRGDLAYNVSFRTRSRDIETDNMLLFEKMFKSFRFID